MAEPPRKNNSKILIVEDEPTIAHLLKDLLSEEEYTAEVAPDGLIAERMLVEWAPDLVLLDLNVPHRSGAELLKEIRKKDRDHGVFIPVIILTGVYTTRNDKINYLNQGADDFLPKPFDTVELLARVRSLLRLRDMYKRSQYLATHDHLTRCYNRRYLMDFLEREVARVKRYKQPFSFLMLDLDRFKDINDRFGHEAGDQVLLHVGFRLQDFFRAVDCVARLGGDEFAAVLPDCGPDEGAKVAELLLATKTEYDNMLTSARSEAQTIFQDGRKKSDAKRAEMLEAAKEDVKTIIENGKKTLEAEKAKMVDDARKEIISLAVEATKKMLAKQDEKASTKEALKELGDM
jgi:diguanylate cyclase (GGDEF)-like protein